MGKNLGYIWFKLLDRQQDFTKAFEEFVEKSLEFSPDFVVFARDLFIDPHPSNIVLACVRLYFWLVPLYSNQKSQPCLEVYEASIVCCPYGLIVYKLRNSQSRAS